MKNTKLLSLFTVAIFALTGCNKKCSKEEFLELANKTETHLYKRATATCKGTSETETQGMTTKYAADDTFKLKYSNNSWNYDGDGDSLTVIVARTSTDVKRACCIEVKESPSPS